MNIILLNSLSRKIRVIDNCFIFSLFLHRCWSFYYMLSGGNETSYKKSAFVVSVWFLRYVVKHRWYGSNLLSHDVIKWKHFPRYWPFVRGIHRSPVNSPHKCRWRGALMFSLICAWTSGWVNNRDAGDLRRHCPHHDVTAMLLFMSSVKQSGASSSCLISAENDIILNHFTLRKKTILVDRI